MKPKKKERKSMLQCSEEKHLKFKQMITETEKKQFTAEATRVCKWFKIEVTISIFGKVIVHWIYPPQKTE